MTLHRATQGDVQVKPARGSRLEVSTRYGHTPVHRNCRKHSLGEGGLRRVPRREEETQWGGQVGARGRRWRLCDPWGLTGSGVHWERPAGAAWDLVSRTSSHGHRSSHRRHWEHWNCTEARRTSRVWDALGRGVR